MRYSLLSRFQGTLLGAALGEIYASQYQQQKSVASSPLKLEESLGVNLGVYPWYSISLLYAQSLIRCGKLDLEAWKKQKSLLSSKIGTASCSEAAIAMLPVALFLHENEAKLRDELVLASSLWQPASPTPSSVLAVGYALALALKEKLHPTTLIPQTLAYLKDSQTPFGQQLEQVQSFLENGSGLEQVVSQLFKVAQPSTTPVVLAFYCFLSTPEDFRLSVTRAIRTAYQPQITAALTGALSGVYNSLNGIPLGWRSSKRSDSGEILQVAAHLLAVWSGVYDTTTTQSTKETAVAAPRVIQPRQGGL